MCLAVPGKVLEIDGTAARVDFGHGAVREVDVSLVDITVGKYVLVHTGYAIQVMEEEEAKASLPYSVSLRTLRTSSMCISLETKSTNINLKG